MSILQSHLPIFPFGNTKCQVGWLVAGLALSHAVFHNDSLTVSFGIGDVSTNCSWGIAIFGLLLIISGSRTGWIHARLLRTCKPVSGRVLRIDEDNSGDSTEYKTAFEYTDAQNKLRVVRMNRTSRDISVGRAVSLVISENQNQVLLEQDLAGGLTFANWAGTRPVPWICSARVLVIPLLMFAPLAALQPSVISFVDWTTDWLGYPYVIWLPVVVQTGWLYKNRQHFGSQSEIVSDCG